MPQLKFAISTLALLLLQSAEIYACSCGGEADLIQSMERGIPFSQNAVVLHGRVVERRSEKEAVVEPIEVFAGRVPVGKRTLIGAPGPGDLCGGSFAQGEEFVYFVNSEGLIYLCSKLRPTPRLLQVLRSAARSRAR